MNTIVSVIKDGFVLRTAFGRKIVANAITKMIKKNTGITCNLMIDNLELSHEENGEIMIKLNVAARTTERDIDKLLDLL